MAETEAQNRYQVKIRGRLRESWSDKFRGMDLSYDEKGNTLVTIRVVDQVALRGILCWIWDLNLEVISLTELQEEISHE